MKWISNISSRLKTRMILAITGIVILASGLLIGVMYLNFKQYAMQSFHQRLRDMVSIAVQQIDGDQHATLVTPDDESSPAYQQIVTRLRAIEKLDGDIDSLYTMRVDADGKIHFIVDSAAEGDGHSALGTEYTEPGPALAANIKNLDHIVIEDDIYSDEYGTYLSGYAPIFRSDGALDGFLGIDLKANAVLAQERGLLLLSLGIFAGVLGLGIVLAVTFANQTSRPVTALARSATQIAEQDIPALVTALDNLAHGDLSGTLHLQATELPVRSKDEISEMTAAFNNMVLGLNQVGASFGLMSAQLRDMIGTISANAGELKGSSDHLVMAASQCASAAQEIAGTSQNVSKGTAEQHRAVTGTAGSVKQMNQAIDGIAQGAQEQARAVQEASRLMQQLKGSLEQLARAAQGSARGGEAAIAASNQGKGTVANVIESVQAIRKQVADSTVKVQEMGQRSEQIGEILNTIDDIASQTNLLALNAAIETARAEAQSERMAEDILNGQMVAQAQIINQLLMEKPADQLNTDFWINLVKRAGIEAVYITDGDGVVVCSNDPDFIGWRFPDDPKEQASDFRKLLTTHEGIICQKTQKNSRYNKLFKYAGVSRMDQPGIVQIAFAGDALERYHLNLGGFGVVAVEVRKLAERSSAETKAISSLICGIQEAVAQAMAAMQAGTAEVETGVKRASEAGAALESIVQTSQVVYDEGTQAVEVARVALLAAKELVNAMESVSAVVEQNSAAMQQMSAGSGDVGMAIERISVVSMQNSSSVEEVSAATEQISAQMEDVMESAQRLAAMAGVLSDAIAYFERTAQDREVEDRTALAAQGHITLRKNLVAVR
jgi:methyl-accepting chemotaxis protein